MNQKSTSPGAACQHDTRTAETGNNVLLRTVLNQPINEDTIRGYVFTKTDLIEAHRRNMSCVPYEDYEKALTDYGVRIEG